MPIFLRRHWYPFSIGAMLVIVTVVAVSKGWWANPKRYSPPPFSPPTPRQIQSLVTLINGPARQVGFIKNIQVPAANRLGEAGEAAKQYGAVEALTAMIANTQDPEAKKAAERALQKINGPEP